MLALECLTKPIFFRLNLVTLGFAFGTFVKLKGVRLYNLAQVKDAPWLRPTAGAEALLFGSCSNTDNPAHDQQCLLHRRTLTIYDTGE